MYAFCIYYRNNFYIVEFNLSRILEVLSNGFSHLLTDSSKRFEKRLIMKYSVISKERCNRLFACSDNQIAVARWKPLMDTTICPSNVVLSQYLVQKNLSITR